MTITRRGAPVKSSNNTGATSHTVNLGTVTAGQMVLVAGDIINVSGTDDVPVAGDLTKTAGTATIDTPQLDKEVGLNCGDGANTFLHATLYSFLVTGSGTLTMQLGGQPAGTFFTLFGEAYNGNWDASRVDGTPNSASNAADSTTAQSSGSVTTAGPGMIASALALNNGAATPITADGLFTLEAEEEDATQFAPGAFATRIVGAGTTDASDWTYSGMDGATYNASAALSVAYKEAAGGGGSSPSLMGRSIWMTA